MASSSITLKALGLNVSDNQLEVASGSLQEASNIIIRRNDVVESRRGFKLYGESFGDSLDRAKQLFSYKSRLLRHYSNILQYDTGTTNFDGEEIFNDFSGNFSEAQAGLRIKSIESNGNFYFTTSDGIKKISAANASQLTTASGFITQAGGIKAIDQTAELVVTPGSPSGFFTEDAAVAYRVVWGTKDNNDNLILGTPSQRTVIYNPLLGLLIVDLMTVLQALDDVSNEGGSSLTNTYVNTLKLPTTATAPDVRTNLISLCSKLDADIGGTTFSSITQPAVPDIPATNDQLIAIQTYLQKIIIALQAEGNPPIPPASLTTWILPLNITTTANVKIVIDIPQDVTTNYFFQIYRSPLALATGTEVLFEDVFPNDELQQVYEAYPTQADLDNGFITVIDTTPDSFLGAFLYTNQFSGDGGGILQANEPPPFALDINRFKNVVFYANTRTKYQLLFNLLGVQKMIDDYVDGITPTITIASQTSSNTYSFVTGVSESTSVVCNAGSTLNNSGTASYFLLNSANNETHYYVWYAIGTATDPALTGKTGIEVLSGAGNTNVEIAEKTRDSVANILQDFITSSSSNTVFITNVNPGYTDDASVGTSGFTITVTTQGRGENVSEETSVFTTVADSSGSLAGKYFTINTAFNKQSYYVWYQVNGSGADPAIANKTGIKVSLVANDSASTVATKTALVLNALSTQFIATTSSSTLTIKNYGSGPANDATVGTSGFSLTVTVQGALEVLLSTNPSVAIAIEDTSLSLQRVINRNKAEVIYAYYLSTGAADSLPGQFLFQARDLSLNPFYIVGNNKDTGISFNPDLTPSVSVNSVGAISIANPTILTSPSHGLNNSDQILITGSNSTPSIDGIYSITYLTTNTFSIPVNVYATSGTSTFSYIKLTDASVAQNEDRPNRVYYSKLNQPEAVPITNNFDVGARDKAILRIFPLRDTLFVFKEDGLFRISGEVAPFVLSLFDGSCFLTAADSLGLSNNLIYGWTRQGITIISEAGVSNPPISRPIDTDTLQLATFSNFSTATWGVGYTSDNSYLVFTVKSNSDTEATICYRYGNLTNSWTTFDITNTCGIVNPIDDKLYLGAGDRNYIEQERKSFTREDYADRDFKINLDFNRVYGTQIKVSTTTDIEVGDVLLQEQTISLYDFNGLLEKLDLDSTLMVPITNITAGTTVTVTTANSDNIANNEYVQISNTNTNPSIDGIYKATYISTTQFQITLSTNLSSPIIVGKARFLYENNLAPSIGDLLKPDLLKVTAKLDSDFNTSYKNYTSDISSKTGSISGISVANPTIITSVAHGLKTGRIITIVGSNSIPSIDGPREVTVINVNTFSVDVSVMTAGTTGSFVTEDNNFDDLKACYNIVVADLNNDSNLSFNNYQLITENTNQEAIVFDVNSFTKTITLNLALPFVSGPITVFKNILCSYSYTPLTFGDSVNFKQMYEATLMFENKAFTNASLNFGTDLLPSFKQVPFNGDGNGIFGFNNFGLGFFGGNSHGAPFRTYIPRDAQRCRYLIVQFTHAIAREKFSIFGVTVTGNNTASSRAYR